MADHNRWASDDYEPNTEFHGLRIFVDNSDLWIRGQGVAARTQRLGVERDPRFRVHYGHLIQAILAGDRWLQASDSKTRFEWRSTDKFAEARIYGSDSGRASGASSIDSVLAVARESGFQQQAFVTSLPHEAEEKVDNQITADITELVCSSLKPELEEDIIVLIVGDRDYRPALRKALKKGFRVEVWAFNEGLSGIYRELESVVDDRGYPMARLHSLTDVVLPTPGVGTAIGFIEYEGKEVSIASSFVAVLRSDHPPISEASAEDAGKACAKALTEKFHRPFIVNWESERRAWIFGTWERKSSQTDVDMCTQFLMAEGESFLPDVITYSLSCSSEKLLTEIPFQRWHPPHRIACEDVVGTKSNSPQTRSDAGEGSKVLQGREAGTNSNFGSSSEASSVSDRADADSRLANDGHRAVERGCVRVRHLGKSGRPPCRFRFNCQDGLLCRREHTPLQIEYFEEICESRRRSGLLPNGGANPSRKTKLCSRGAACCVRHCDYYHIKERDAWCTRCCEFGHLSGEELNCRKHLV